METIFLGGLDRGYDFLPLVEKIKKSQIKNIVFFPESGEKIFSLLQKEGVRRTGGSNVPSPSTESPLPPFHKGGGMKRLSTSSMEEAVKFAYQHTSKGKICLLSTASPSYSVWKNFEEKGDLFQEWVRKL